MSQSSLDSTTKSKQELEKIQLKVLQANQHLTHLENEVQVVSRRRQAIKDELDSATQVLLREREAELEKLESLSASQLGEIQIAVEESKKLLKEYSQEVIALQGTARGLEAVISDLNSQVEIAKTELDGAIKAVEPYKRQKIELEARVKFIHDQISPLETQQLVLKEDIARLESQESGLQAKTATLEVNYINRKEAIENDLAILLARQQELEVAQAAMLQQYEQMTQDIAVRTKVLDERDEILKRREYKVDQDARKVARNAGLLQL